MASAYVLLSHILTDIQCFQLQKIGIENINLPDKDLQIKWANVPAEGHSIKEYSKPFILFLETARSGDYVIVQGDFGLTFIIVKYCLERGLIPMYATTIRRHVEHAELDGVHIKKVFSHVRFRKYGV